MKASDITQAQFDEALEEILDDLNGGQLLAIPGIYEIVSEHFNNEIIEAVIAAAEERKSK